MIRMFAGAAVLALALSGCIRETDSAIQERLAEMEYRRHIQTGKIAAHLNHDSPDVRRMAVHAIAQVQDTAHLPLIANRLRDPDAGVRAEAIFALGQLYTTSEHIDQFLRETLERESDPANRLAVIDAIGKSGSTDFLDAIHAEINSGDLDRQRHAARAVARMAYRGLPVFEFAPVVSALMIDASNTAVATEAAYAVYRVGVLDSFRELAQALERSDPMYRYFVLKGLKRMVELMDSPEFEPLKTEDPYRGIWTQYTSRDFQRKLLVPLQDSTWYVRLAACDLLGAVGGQVSQNELVGMLDDPHPGVRLQVIRSLGTMPNWTTRKEMRRIYSDDDDWRMRGEALVVLARIQPEEALAHVREDWLNRPWPEASYAIAALEAIRSDDPARPIPESEPATQLLLQLADGQQLARATAALEALVNRPQVPEAAFFAGRLAEADPATVAIVATYFAGIEGPKPGEAVQPLMDAYAALKAPEDREAMILVLDALGNLGSREALPLLTEAAASPYPDIRRSARAALVVVDPGADLPAPPAKDAPVTRWDFPMPAADSLYALELATDGGAIVIDLFSDEAPVTVANILSLARKRYYDGIYFHRVIPGFVAQGGDPRGDGWGGPGYAIPCEYNDRHYDRGMVGMALSGKDTGGSQWFITHTPQPHLDGRYTLFGKVREGMAVADSLLPYDRIQTARVVATAR